MEVKIKSCLDGAKEAEGISVIIDVFRASNTIIACIGQGVESIIPVGELDEAYNLKKQNPTYLLFGERKGLPPKGFDYGNSPATASKLNLKNKKIILTTSAGSQGIVHAKKSDEIIIGSFANAKAIIDYIKSKNPNKVSLVAMGFESGRKAEEDELCAEYLKELLLGENSDFDKMKQKILKCDGADRLRSLKQEDDLEFSLKLDIYDIVPKYNFESRTLINQKRLF
jgi:2-phosphosulfolactate phosphatase